MDAADRRSHERRAERIATARAVADRDLAKKRAEAEQWEGIKERSAEYAGLVNVKRLDAESVREHDPALLALDRRLVDLLAEEAARVTPGQSKRWDQIQDALECLIDTIGNEWKDRVYDIYEQTTDRLERERVEGTGTKDSVFEMEEKSQVNRVSNWARSWPESRTGDPGAREDLVRSDEIRPETWLPNELQVIEDILGAMLHIDRASALPRTEPAWGNAVMHLERAWSALEYAPEEVQAINRSRISAILLCIRDGEGNAVVHDPGTLFGQILRMRRSAQTPASSDRDTDTGADLINAFRPHSGGHARRSPRLSGGSRPPGHGVATLISGVSLSIAAAVAMSGVSG